MIVAHGRVKSGRRLPQSKSWRPLAAPSKFAKRLGEASPLALLVSIVCAELQLSCRFK